MPMTKFSKFECYILTSQPMNGINFTTDALVRSKFLSLMNDSFASTPPDFFKTKINFILGWNYIPGWKKNLHSHRLPTHFVEMTAAFCIIDSIEKRWKTKISFYHFSFQFSREEHGETVTVSKMLFHPKINDHEKEITCRAENTEVASSAIDDAKVLNVHCKTLHGLLNKVPNMIHGLLFSVIMA